MVSSSQTDFSGGLNYIASANRIGENEYRLGFNVRCRSGILSGVKSSDIDTAAPSGVKAGIVNFGSYLVLFSDGFAYYKATVSSAWTLIAGWIQFNAVSDRYFTAEVPAAELLFARKLTDANTSNGTALDPKIKVDPAALINGNVAGLVVQDGLNQPQVIYSSGGVLVARTLQTYTEWTNNDTDREYVPVGKQMVFFDGILYLASADGSKLYRSVSGRPLDFMVNITTTGDKPAPLEADGGADTTAYPIGFAPITAMYIQSEAFILVCTENDVSYGVLPNYDSLIFGEPTFLRRLLLDTAGINQFAGVDILGDFALISRTGIRSYNAVLQTKNEGRNSVFSLMVSGLIGGIHQTDASCVGSYDNYVFFSLSTIYGFLVVVYDSLIQKFVSLDSVYTTAQIKQFATLDPASENPTFWAITTDNKVIQLYKGGTSGTTYANAGVILRGVSAVVPGTQLKMSESRLLFDMIPDTAAITVSIAGLVDNKLDSNVSGTKTKLPPTSSAVTILTLPVTLPSGDTSLDLLFTTPNANLANTSQLIVSFSGNCSLASVTNSYKDSINGNPLRSQ